MPAQTAALWILIAPLPLFGWQKTRALRDPGDFSGPSLFVFDAKLKYGRYMKISRMKQFGDIWLQHFGDGGLGLPACAKPAAFTRRAGSGEKTRGPKELRSGC
jgi:hypothetical protein